MKAKIINKNIIISDDFTYLNDQISKITNNMIIVIDDNLYNLYSNKLLEIMNNVKFIIINHGEENKNLTTVTYICEKLLEYGVTRGDTIIGFGGGVTLDIVGFVAGILYRGIDFISIPTSLLAMVDASVGGKTGVDFMNYKNIIGLFKEPKFVFINPKFLDTLPYDEYICGLGEIIKYKLLDNNFNLDLPIEDLIINSINLKLSYVNKDFLDKGYRMFLNLGHTFGHHIELKYNISHGLAVVNGIKAILDLELDLNIINDNVYNYFINIVNKYNIKLLDINYKDYLDLIFIDKKNIRNTLNLIFIDNDLKPFIYKTTKEELNEKIKNN